MTTYLGLNIDEYTSCIFPLLRSDRSNPTMQFKVIPTEIERLYVITNLIPIENSSKLHYRILFIIDGSHTFHFVVLRLLDEFLRCSLSPGLSLSLVLSRSFGSQLLGGDTFSLLTLCLLLHAFLLLFFLTFLCLLFVTLLPEKYE